MNSIKTKILTSYLTIIGCVVILLIITTIVHYGLINKYEQINSNLVDVQTFNETAIGLTDDAYSGFKTNDYSVYDKRLNDIKAIEKILDSRFQDNKASLIAYRGAKNSLAVIIKDISETKKQLDQSSDLESISSFYQENVAKFEYVKQNVTDLILTETENLARVSRDVQKIQAVLTFAIITIIVLGTAGSIILAFALAKKITAPIIDLSEIAKSITRGNLKLSVSSYLLAKKDEIGSLANSFDLMLIN